jgi:hypothetical protein
VDGDEGTLIAELDPDAPLRLSRAEIMEYSTRRLITIVLALTMAGVLACGGGSPNPSGPDSTSGGSGSGSGGGSNGGGSSATGSLSINITDSPFSDAKALLVTFSEVNVHRADGDSWQRMPFASGGGTRTCDLKKLQGRTDVLGVGPLASGHYTQVRLVVSSAAIYFDNSSSGPACAPAIAPPAGKSASVEVPSGEVKLNHEFTITSSASTMLVDFDGDRSIKQTGSDNGKGNSNTKYMMTPVIRVVSVQ